MFFFQQVLFRTDRFDANAILDQTNEIPLPIALIKSFDDRTGKGRTFKAEVDAANQCAISDIAFSAMIGLTLSLSSATVAGFLFPEMHITNRTVYPARGQHFYRNGSLKLHRWKSYFKSASYFLRFFASGSLAMSTCALDKSASSFSCLLSALVD